MKKQKKDYLVYLNYIIQLYNPINRTFNKDYSLEENKKEYQQWVKISNFFAQAFKENILS